MEFTLLWAALAGALALYGALWWMGRRDTTLCVRDLWEIAVTAGIIGLVVGRMVSMLRGGVNPVTNLGDFILVRAGVDTVAAAVGALLAAAWLARSDLLEQLDGLAPAAVFGVAGWQAGCLFRDACLGSRSSLPWAWAQTGSDITRHPIEIYAALGLGVAAWLLFRVRLRYPAAGVVSGLGLAVVGLVRLLTEPLRPSLFAGPTWWYGAAVGVGLAATLWATRRRGSTRTVEDPTALQ